MTTKPGDGKRSDSSGGSSKQYLVLRGINYGAEGKRAEVGEKVSDIPSSAIAGLESKGAIMPVSQAKSEGE